MQLNIDALVTIALPPEWERHDLSNGTAFARVADVAKVGGDVRFAPLTFFVSVLDNDDESLEDVAADLMSHRVQQGYPERFSATIAGLPALGFGWTDGILDIRSFFVQARSGPALEFQVARAFHPAEFLPDAPPPTLGSVASEILSHVQWRDCAG